MNILFIITSLGGGGAERVTSHISSSLAEKNNVFIVTYYENKSSYSVSSKAKVICLNIRDGKNAIDKIINSIKRIRQLRVIKRTNNVNVSISMLASPNFENVMSHRNERLIVSLRNKMSEKCKGMNSLINQYTCRKADVVVAVSKNVIYDQNKYFNTPISKMVNIYNPCNFELINSLASQSVVDNEFESIIGNSSNIVITIGRLTRQKAHCNLIQSFAEVVKNKPDAILIILGDGKLKDALLDLVKKKKLEKRVYMLGFKENPYYYLKRSKVFVLSSLYEGFANVLLEAMACDLPIVACDCNPGPRELIAPDTDLREEAIDIQYEQYGILTPPFKQEKWNSEDPVSTQEEMLATAIIKVLDDNRMREHYIEKSKQRIKDFSLEKITSEWEKILQ